MDYDEMKMAVERGISNFMDSGVWSYLEAPRVTITPQLFIDGNQWCAMLGENLMTGIAGFGDTPYDALLAFQKEMTKPIQSSEIK